MVKKRFWCCVGVAVGITCVPFPISALNHNATSIRGLSQAYGFLHGQELTLARISDQFPELAPRVQLVQAQFGLTFPGIRAKLETELTSAVGDEKFRDVKRELDAKLRETLGRWPLTLENSSAFLDLVGARSKGQIESPVFEYLLALKYASSPVSEFLDRFRQRFITDGQGKARGIKLALQLPRSWAASDGERPHIVQKWTSENGTGLENIMLDIREAEGPEPNRAEIEDSLRSGEVKRSLPRGAVYVDSGTFSVERRTGFWMQTKVSSERAGVNLYQGVVMYQFFFRGSAIGICVRPEACQTRPSKWTKR